MTRHLHWCIVGTLVLAAGGSGAPNGNTHDAGEQPASTVEQSGQGADTTVAEPAKNNPGVEEVAAPPAFRVFNTMLYTNMPSAGLRMPIVYEQVFFPQGKTQIDGTPTAAGITQAVENAHAQYEAPWNAQSKLVIVDIERWHVWPFATGAAHELSIKRYGNSLRRFRKAMQQPVCLYAIAPQAGINHANLAMNNPSIRTEWTNASNIAADRLVPHVDAMCPSLYTYYQGDTKASRQQRIEQWKVYARETITEARRIAPGKPVYPFLWPQFHGGGNAVAFDFLPDDYWRAQLQTIKEYADGVILWGGWNFDSNRQLPWDPDASWWRVFQQEFPEYGAPRPTDTPVED